MSGKDCFVQNLWQSSMSCLFTETSGTPFIYQNLMHCVYQNLSYPVCLPKPQVPCLFTKTSGTLFIDQNLSHPVYLPKPQAHCLPKPQSLCLFTKTSGTLFIYQNLGYPVCLPKPQAPCLFTKNICVLEVMKKTLTKCCICSVLAYIST